MTSDNRIEYIHLVADYKLNRQIRNQCNAFRWEVLLYFCHIFLRCSSYFYFFCFDFAFRISFSFLSVFSFRLWLLCMLFPYFSPPVFFVVFISAFVSSYLFFLSFYFFLFLSLLLWVCLFVFLLFVTVFVCLPFSSLIFLHSAGHTIKIFHHQQP